MATRTLLVYLLGILILAATDASALGEDVAQTTVAAVTETAALEEQPTTLPAEKVHDEVPCDTEPGTTQAASTDGTVTEDGSLTTTEDPASRSEVTTDVATETSAETTAPPLEASSIPEATDGATTTTPTPNPPLETSSIPEPTDPPCFVEGMQRHETDCRAYTECSSSGSSAGSPLRLATKFCADNEAFSTEFGRCSRDISSCGNAVTCLSKASVADPLSNSSYYMCEPRLAGDQIMMFHVQCGDNEVFYPELGKCYVDFLSPAQPPFLGFPPYNWNVIRDIDLVKAELKLIKEHDKLKLKQEKERLKAEKKLQKEREKEAKRLAKEQAKLVEEQVKQESAQFICVQAGNFPSAISDTFYFSCTVKKTKYKLTVQKCPLGSMFNAERAVCASDVLPGADAGLLGSEEENSDDED